MLYSCILPQFLAWIFLKSLFFQILNKFNLHIKDGQRVAILGQSGSGKSTLLALLQRFYDVNQGQVRLIHPHSLHVLGVFFLFIYLSVCMSVYCSITQLKINTS